jgi:hypothetical protein
MKKLFLLFTITAPAFVYSQSLVPDVVATSGSTFSNGTSQLDWTLGEPATFTFTAGSTTLTQGFHQPNLLITALPASANDFLVNIFPNPVTDQVQLQMDAPKEDLKVVLTGADGKLILSMRADKLANITIPMETLPGGTYFISLSGAQISTSTYKVIKLK